MPTRNQTDQRNADRREALQSERAGDLTRPKLERTALLLVDVQNDFCPGGALAVPAADRVIAPLNSASARFAAAGQPVYASRDWHPPDSTHFQAFGGRWPVHCVAGSPGAQFHPDLKLPGDTIVVSAGQGREDDGYSAFEGTTTGGRALADDLRARGIEELYVGGIATDYCVRASVLDARKAGFRVTVLDDAVAGIDPDDSRRALEEMRAAGAALISSGELGWAGETRGT
ncbi:MAG TPA: nicotinamidase [Vicinamibacterales bacterium]|nr:nicotinamidase [Vicinamibacterales bacterium]